ncbi:DinB family protein [Sporosarcina sp. Sa2YVA2]|uniref:DinB family protein n=1 Tax=Sporosarcina quadrami TaxID=2762234 RepID=A0ABR8UDK9_9BACL|nr:DinB family protein [Sporosarcina quadrami]MBD7985664.1 DinB family protein [Sporosarcina quadrami]
MLYELFRYNWQVRDEWIKWCESLSKEELSKMRTGGMKSILHNLFHVIDCEQLWINQLQETPVIHKDIEEITSLIEIKEFSNSTRRLSENFIKKHENSKEKKIFILSLKSGEKKHLTYDKVLYHIITHEIHHIGQLSVWAREIGKKPVSTDLIFKDIEI